MVNKKKPRFYERLKQLRESRGLSYRQMSKILQEDFDVNIAHATIAKWEQPRDISRIPKEQYIAALCRLFNVRPDFLLDELFSEEKKKKRDRIEDYADVDLLSEDDHQLLLTMKSRMLAQRITANKESGNGTN